MIATDPWTSADRDSRLRRALLGGIIVRLSTFPLSLVTVALATRALGPTQYGVFASVTAIMMMAVMTDVGVGRAMVMRIAQSHGRDDLAQMRVVVSSALCTTACMGVIGGLAFLVSTLWVPWPRLLGAPGLADGDVLPVVLALGITLMLNLPISRGAAVLQGMQRDATTQQWALGAVATTVLGIAIAYLVHAPLWVFASVSLGAPVLVNAVQFTWVMTRVFPELRPARADVHWTVVKDLLKTGPAYAAIHLSALALSVDLVIVGYRLGADTAAILSVTVSLFAPVMSSLLMAMNQLWAAMNEAVARGDHDWVRTRLRKTLILGFGLSAGSSVVIAIVAEPVARIWVGPHFVPPLTLVLLAIPWVVYSVMIFQVGSVLAATGRVHEQGGLAAVALVVNVAVVWFAVGAIGSEGAFLGSLVTYVLIVGIPSALMARNALRSLG